MYRGVLVTILVVTSLKVMIVETVKTVKTMKTMKTVKKMKTIKKMFRKIEITPKFNESVDTQ